MTGTWHASFETFLRCVAILIIFIILLIILLVDFQGRDVMIFLACSTCTPHADHTLSSQTFILQIPHAYLTFSMCLSYALHVLSSLFTCVHYIYIFSSLQISSLASL